MIAGIIVGKTGTRVGITAIVGVRVGTIGIIVGP